MLLTYRCLVWAYQLIEYQMCKEWSLAEFDTLGKSTSAPPERWVSGYYPVQSTHTAHMCGGPAKVGGTKKLVD